MNSTVEIIKYCLLALVALVSIVISTLYLRSDILTSLPLSVFLIILSVLGIPLFLWAFKKAHFFWKIGNIVNKLEGLSLRMLAGKRGLPFTTLSEGAIRYLIELNLIKVVVFPGTLDYIYFLTDLGRFLLERVLRYPLYPKSFCAIQLLKYWRGYPEEFVKEKRKFENYYKISLERCCEILKEQFIKQGLLAQEDSFLMFDTYYKEKQEDFSSINDEIIKPWKLQVEKEKLNLLNYIYNRIRTVCK